jgi:hypothetical protein
VFSKSFRQEHEVMVNAARSRGARIVADYCDDHFERSDIGTWYTKLARTPTRWSQVPRRWPRPCAGTRDATPW